jgi:hypothetical protein
MGILMEILYLIMKPIFTIAWILQKVWMLDVTATYRETRRLKGLIESVVYDRIVEITVLRC